MHRLLTLHPFDHALQVNYLLLIHHAGFFIFCIIDFIIKSNFVVKIALIFDYFVCW